MEARERPPYEDRNEFRKAIFSTNAKRRSATRSRTCGAPVPRIYEYGHLPSTNVLRRRPRSLIEDLSVRGVLARRMAMTAVLPTQKRVLHRIDRISGELLLRMSLFMAAAMMAMAY